MGGSGSTVCLSVYCSQFYPLHCLLLPQEQTKVLPLMHIHLWIRFHGVPSLSHICFQFSSVQSLSCVRLFVTPWTAACQASLCLTNSQSPPKPMSIELVMPSNHLILCHRLLFLPSIFPSIQMSQFFASGGQSIGASALAPILLMNIQDWFPLGWTGWISVQAKGLSFPTTPQFKSINSSVLSFLYSPTFTSIHDYWKP